MKGTLLIYSPDDKAYYYQRFSDWKVTQLFKSQKEARQAKKDGLLKWENKDGRID